MGSDLPALTVLIEFLLIAVTAVNGCHCCVASQNFIGK
ncbi:putative membrane protein [Synechococcus sp. PROS-9-1]|nr:putative membrane protein [Synechococcus sp. PROS-9-1]